MAANMERLVEMMGAGDIEPAPMLEIAALSQRQRPETARHG
jgi:hypothetical protein